MKVSELITIEEVKQWKSGDIITISAGTGAGKSYFIKNDLYEYCKQQGKKILMLIHRRNCVDQFQMELDRDGKNDVIDIMTYQKLEAQARRFENIELGGYDYIVADEFHYFLDEHWNKYADLSLKAILDRTDAIRIFMSATGNQCKQFLNSYMSIPTIDYTIPKDYSNIEELKFYINDIVLDGYVQGAIENNLKSIFFIQSAKKAYELHKKYKDHSMFNCSKGNDKYYKYVDEEKVNKMLAESRFEDLILFTTTVMDSGVSIIDSELNHIVVDVQDIGTLIQCVGRKRFIDENDKLKLHIKMITNNRLGGIMTQNKNRITQAEEMLANGVQGLIANFYRKIDEKMIYDDVVDGAYEKKVNMLMYYKVLMENALIDHLIEKGKDGYADYLAEIFEQREYTVYEKEQMQMSLEEYLDSMVGEVMLRQADRKELIEMLDVRDGRNNRLLKGISTLNGALKEKEMDYVIDEFQTSRMEDGKKKNYKAAWRVRRLSDI